MRRGPGLRTAKGWTAAFALGAALAGLAHADMYRPAPALGGIDSRPYLDSPVVKGSNVTLHFHGLQAPYEVQSVPLSLLGASPVPWQTFTTAALMWPDQERSITISNVPGPTFFRLRMPGRTYVGPIYCNACHDEKVSSWMKTGHATAFETLKDAGGNVSASNMQNCAVCHSVGYGKGGFVSVTNTPDLAGVGCEACHGASGTHAFVSERKYHPVATIAAEVCGGCHTTATYPTYDEWTNSAHATVTPDVANGASGISDPTNGFSRQMNCGPCHSGATRLAMVSDAKLRGAGYTNRLALPTASDGAYYGITCAVCHDSHTNDLGPHQLRNPLFSTDFYSFVTGADVRTNINTDVFGVSTTNLYYMNTVFVTQYVARVQICAQCHNSRGALWTGTSRPPHHSPQYNVFIGIAQPGYLNGTNNLIGPHGLNTNGCTPCHMASRTVANPTPSNPNHTGHNFKMTFNNCASADCHDSTNVAAALMTAVQLDTTTRIQGVVDLLNSWATNKAPAITNSLAAYGKYAWEFTTPGQLSNPTNNPAIAGPSSALQSRIPDSIKKARFNVYLIEHDASKGVHNIDYTRFLLKDARTNILNALQ
jgi:hypothetical protein